MGAKKKLRSKIFGTANLIVLQIPFLLVLSLEICSVAARSSSHGDQGDQDEMSRQRLLAKPWYMRSIEIGGKPIVSPVTLVIGLVALVNIVYGFTSNPTWVEASHILIEEKTPATEKMLKDMKRDIGSNYQKFGEYASKYSKCPSKSNGGALGRFKEGVMAYSFNKAVFDPKSKVGTTIGPFETPFGWHLIYITQRKIDGKNV